MTNLFQTGCFRLHSRQHSTFKIDCDALTDADLETIANQIYKRCPLFGQVEGVPRGGLRLAAVLHPYATGKETDPLLIADDVYTTGASMEAHRNGRKAIGVVIFARSEPSQEWINALFTMDPFTWPRFAVLKEPIDG